MMTERGLLGRLTDEVLESSASIVFDQAEYRPASHDQGRHAGHVGSLMC